MIPESFPDEGFIHLLTIIRFCHDGPPRTAIVPFIFQLDGPSLNLKTMAVQLPPESSIPSVTG